MKKIKFYLRWIFYFCITIDWRIHHLQGGEKDYMTFKEFKEKQWENFIKERKFVEANYNHKIMQIKYSNGDIEEYKGSSIVWFKMPMMERCSTSKEYWLCQLYEYINTYGNPYPQAHKK